MSEAARENKIVAASETLEYLVHGHWEPTQGHANGRFGAWWVDIYYILKSGLPEQQLNSKLGRGKRRAELEVADFAVFR